MVWYSHLLKNLSQFVVIHTVKVFRVVNEAEIDYEVVLGTLNAEFQRIEAERNEGPKSEKLVSDFPLL